MSNTRTVPLTLEAATTDRYPHEWAVIGTETADDWDATCWRSMTHDDRSLLRPEWLEPGRWPV